MKNFKKLLFCMSVSAMFLCSCSNSNVNSEKISKKFFEKSFYSRDNGYIFTGMENGITEKITIQLPDYCWDKQSGVIIDKNGKVFEKPDRRYSNFTVLNPKFEKKDGKIFINSDSKFFENYRFELKDEFTIVDTLLNIEYTDNLGKYGIDTDSNEYKSTYREAKELADEFKTLVSDLEKYKDQLPEVVKKEIEREMKYK